MNDDFQRWPVEIMAMASPFQTHVGLSQMNMNNEC